MRKIFYLLICALALSTVFSSCSLSTVDGDEEGVFVLQPWFFGHGGVSQRPLTEGSTWRVWSTRFVKFKVVPVRYDESFDDDAFSDDNTPLDVTAYLTVQIQRGKTPELLQKFGENWFENNLRVKFRTLIRGEICKYSMYDLVSNRDCLLNINKTIYEDISKYVKTMNIPVTICSVDVNKVKPNAGVLNEMNETAVQIQGKQTQLRRTEMEKVRTEAEAQRARADKAYREEMGLTADQFIALQWVETAQKNGASVDILVGSGGGTDPIWNIRRK